MLSNDLPGKVQSCTVICKSLAFWLRIRAMLCPKVMLSASSPNESQSHSYSREGICKKHIRHRHDSPQVCSTKMPQTTLKPTHGGGEKSVLYHFEVDPQFSPKTIATPTDFKDPIPTASGSAPILPRFGSVGAPSASCICKRGEMLLTGCLVKLNSSISSKVAEFTSFGPVSWSRLQHYTKPLNLTSTPMLFLGT